MWQLISSCSSLAEWRLVIWLSAVESHHFSSTNLFPHLLHRWILIRFNYLFLRRLAILLHRSVQTLPLLLSLNLSSLFLPSWILRRSVPARRSIQIALDCLILLVWNLRCQSMVFLHYRGDIYLLHHCMRLIFSWSTFLSPACSHRHKWTWFEAVHRTSRGTWSKSSSSLLCIFSHDLQHPSSWMRFCLFRLRYRGISCPCRLCSLPLRWIAGRNLGDGV